MPSSLPTNDPITLTGVGTLPIVKAMAVLGNGDRVVLTTDNASGAAHDPVLTIVSEDGSSVVQSDLLADFNTSGTTWDNTRTSIGATIVALPGNDFAVSWSDGSGGGDTHAYFQVYDDTGTPLTAVTQIDATEVSGDLNRFVKMAVMSNGNIAAVWAENGTAYGLRVFQPDGTPVTGQIAIDSVTGNPGGSEYTHYIAASGNTLMVIYQAYGTTGTEDLHTYFTLVDGTTGTILDGGSSHQVSSIQSSGSQTYNVVALSNGNFAVLYPAGSGTDLAIIKPDGSFVVQDQSLLGSIAANTGIYALADGGFVITHGGNTGTTLLGDIYDNGGVLQASSVALSGYTGSSTATSYVTASGYNDGLVTAEREGNGSTSSVIQLFGHTNDSSACFAAGTRIATETGAISVETLREGDRVLLAGGGSAPVRWVGHRVVECGRHGAPLKVLPVRILAGAFADGVPAADLVLSPDHSVFVDGVLIPVRHLVNGATVRREAAARVSYWHVELPDHAALLAEGLACESYLDTGNRGAFANGGAVVLKDADFGRGVWQTASFAPQVQHGAVRDAVHARLLARAEALGFVINGDPALVLEVDGREIPGLPGTEGLRFVLPAGARHGILRSHSFIPSEQGDSDDSRQLGVAVARLALDGRSIDPHRLRHGWQAPERDWRWTDGAGRIALDGAGELVVTLAMTGRYRHGGARRPVAA